MNEKLQNGREASGSRNTQGEENATSGNGFTTSRRRFLSALGAGVAAPAVMTGTSEAAVEDQYGTVYDIVEDGGADNTGGESITPILRDLCDDDTLIKFPPGEYYMDEQFRFTGFENFGLVGDDATLVPANYYDFDGPQYRLFRLGIYYSPGRDLRVEGFTVDLTADDTGIRAIEAQVSDGLVVRDIRIEGQHDSGTFGPALFDVTDPNGTGVIERFYAPDGGAYSDETPGDLWRGPTGILVSTSHEGTVRFKDCYVGAFPDNGLYAVTDGRVVVEGGTYKNSQAASIRLGGDGCTVDGATVKVDDWRPGDTNQRGIRLDEGSDLRVENSAIILDKPNGHAISVMNDVDSARIHNSRIVIGDEVNHGIVVSPYAGPTTITNSAIEINGGGNAIQINGSDAGRVLCQYVDITGNASGNSWRHAIKCNRNDCEFRVVDITQNGTNYRRGIEVNGDDCLVYKGQFETTHHPIIVNGARTWIEGITAASSDGYQAIRLNDQSYDATIKNNELANGILDKGSSGLSFYGNEIL